MRPSSLRDRGFTLLEVMIASALGVVVLTTGLVVGTQMQKRALFEEQTMMAQVTGRAVKELLTLDLARAGAGMGNTPLSFSYGDRSAITVWYKPDMAVGVAGAGGTMGPDPTFAPAPTTALASDALEIYWGETSGMVTLAPCTSNSFRQNATSFCTVPNPALAMSATPAILVSGGLKVSCPVNIVSVSYSAPDPTGTLTINGPASESAACNPGAPTWKKGTVTGDVENWLALRMGGGAYRVNWKNNIPTLEYRAAGQTAWVVVSRDVEQLTVREGVMDFDRADNTLDWYPGTNAYNLAKPHPPISQCKTADFGTKACWLGGKESDGTTPAAPASDAELITRLRQRVRQLEVTLVVRTRRSNQDAVQAGTDEEGYVRDGYKRRRFTFKVEPRNFMSVGMIRKPAEPTGATP
ncbi:PilW family protein [Corallococcus llansteffanensis]|uniref:Prepilin-type N-terminal cleavage/methylation domain-containing protein n=1 Tax=Corallococcus llansteffanensis TaxID=2316731 RepID=A0A3A8QP69_9BACT|nr:prepilin-type N-terminal cleavage/methylation domain-containing protein [Corallococcus llansteffanensis]RKH65004.1 prepilin-type N-terminal cleavage/methylation domain-containing protein [Corallococcus llansteffanensis]